MSGLYQTIFVKCKTKRDDNGDYILDLPFPIFMSQVLYNGKNYYHQIPQQDCEVVAFVSVRNEDLDQAKKYEGYVAFAETKEGREYINSCKEYTTHWTEKMSDYKATVNELGVKTPYAGLDKDDSSPCGALLIDEYYKVVK